MDSIDTLDRMFTLQKYLLDKYKIIESLPDYPIDLNSRKGQSLIRDFIGRYTEELSEAFVEAEEAANMIQSNNPVEAKAALVRFNEEIADSNHFLLEILIYSGIGFRDLNTMCRESFKPSGLSNLFIEGNPMVSLLRLGHFLNSRVNIDQSILYSVFTTGECLGDERRRGGKKISPTMVSNTYSKYLWQIVNGLNVAKGLLKNKDWKKEEKGINEAMYRAKLFDTVTLVFQFFDLIFLTETSIYQSYISKNQINLERIKNNY